DEAQRLELPARRVPFLDADAVVEVAEVVPGAGGAELVLAAVGRLARGDHRRTLERIADAARRGGSALSLVDDAVAGGVVGVQPAHAARAAGEGHVDLRLGLDRGRNRIEVSPESSAARVAEAHAGDAAGSDAEQRHPVVAAVAGGVRSGDVGARK